LAPLLGTAALLLLLLPLWLLLLPLAFLSHPSRSGSCLSCFCTANNSVKTKQEPFNFLFGPVSTCAASAQHNSVTT
jgi:hypothetical protein